jgi:hypothetical protein
MAVLLLRCVVDSSLRQAGRPLAAWLRELGTQVGAVVHEMGSDAEITGPSHSPATLVEQTVRAVEVCFQATPQQCARIARRIRRARVPVLLMKVLDTEQATFFAPA